MWGNAAPIAASKHTSYACGTTDDPCRLRLLTPVVSGLPLARLQNNPSWLSLPCQFRNTAKKFSRRSAAESSDP
jgi:hypothetical protein